MQHATGSSRNCITAETLNATQDVGSSPYRTPFNYPLNSLFSPFYIFNTPDWPYATKSDTCINVVRHSLSDAMYSFHAQLFSSLSVEHMQHINSLYK